ncbi:MAG: 23S rRNA (guanosine(2251)-2'-O)-methyltransferase RlmB [Clostridia bacterium]|nr:23S rRNA (guanosine(2251)-2'-O)-methyltransferase RlmB [Clostridia bacterium]
MKYYDKKGREERSYNKAPVEQNENLIGGRNAVKELLATERDIDKILVARGDRDGSIVVLVSEAIARKIPVIETDRKKMDTLFGSTRHQGIIAMAAERNYYTVDDILAYADEKGEKPFIVIADGVEDPHNLGAIIRSAECAGAHGLIIPKRRAVGLTSVVAKSSAGAIEHLKIAKVTNLASTIDDLKEKGVWIYAADMGDTSYYDLDYKTATAIVLGSEGNGISRLVKEKCDFVTSIPLYGKVNSLNVSNAAAVIFCEIARQRNI